MAVKSKNLGKAKVAKNDEFYTKRGDIEKELRHYHKQLKGKVIYMNCDDPEKSEFWQYFVRLFNILELKGLIATHYDPNKENFTYKLELLRDDVDPELEIVGEELIKKEPLLSNGDFRSACCIELLEQADVVITNPPFSLFREYIQQLMDYNKQFLCIGPLNARTYKEVFPFFKEERIWTGYTAPKDFKTPDGGEKKFGNVCWYTNIPIEKRKEHLDLRGSYLKDREYPKYDNYDAIEVARIDYIPCDYDGVMGVPISYLDKHNPDDFEILGITNADPDNPVRIVRDYTKFKGFDAKGISNKRTGSTFGNCAVIEGNDGEHCYYTDGEKVLQPVYKRLFIRNKHPEPRKA